eukprot:CAMPEP_0170497292 /NCGR_PEP_ID=MMETSP0208-20121228/24335_1 /TAXON_ID=197538 /ORGANISM="Strombidium inclinatum, Strain S3" /LENGTH=43 /DNA_ID= /DNA_START= /DNA_END= /DNA_ORIENTATION=
MKDEESDSDDCLPMMREMRKKKQKSTPSVPISKSSSNWKQKEE